MAVRQVTGSAVYVLTRTTGTRRVSVHAVQIVIRPQTSRRVSTGALAVILRPETIRHLSAGGLYVVTRAYRTDVAVLFNDIELTDYIGEAHLKGTLNRFESTHHAGMAAEFIPTTSLWAFPLGGLWSIELDHYLGVWSITGMMGTFRLRFKTVIYTWLQAFCADYRVSAAAPDAGIIWLATVTGVGAPQRTA